MVMAACGLLLLSRIPVHGHYWPDVLPGIIVMSLGMGFTFVPVTLIATTNIEQGDAGLASGIFNTSQQIGGAVGLAVLSTFFINTASNYLADHGGAQASAADQAQAQVDGYSVAFMIGAGFMLAAAVLIAVLVRKADVAQISENPQPVAA
jgi:MFS family permease